MVKWLCSYSYSIVIFILCEAIMLKGVNNDDQQHHLMLSHIG